MVDVDEWNNHNSKCNDLTKFCTKQRKNLQDPVVVQGADRPHLPHESIFPLEAWHLQIKAAMWLTPRHSDTTAMHKSDPERMNNPTGLCATLSFLKPKKKHRKAATRKSLFSADGGGSQLYGSHESGWHSGRSLWTFSARPPLAKQIKIDQIAQPP